MNSSGGSACAKCDGDSTNNLVKNTSLENAYVISAAIMVVIAAATAYCTYVGVKEQLSTHFEMLAHESHLFVHLPGSADAAIMVYNHMKHTVVYSEWGRRCCVGSNTMHAELASFLLWSTCFFLFNFFFKPRHSRPTTCTHLFLW